METRKEQAEKTAQADLTWDSQGNTVTLCNEVDREGQVPDGAIASITLTSKDQSWGEFLTGDQAIAALRWLEALVGEAALGR